MALDMQLVPDCDGKYTDQLVRSWDLEIMFHLELLFLLECLVPVS